MTKPYSLDLRERVTERVAAGDSVRAVATIFTVSVASVVRWSQRLGWRTGLAHGADRGRARGDRARAHDETRRTRRCRQLWHGLEFHPSRGNELQKKAYCRPSKIAPTWRAAGRVGKNISRGYPARLVFIDETWVKTNMAPIRGWCARGRRLAAKIPHGHWKTMTFLAALRCDRIEAPWVLDGPINGESFRTYVDQVLAPTLKPGDVVILDNLGSTRARRCAAPSGLAEPGFCSCRPIPPTSTPSNRSSPN